MGYRASANKVYRYLCRLDEQERLLTDGFCLSIVFVNDDSLLCRDLIERYFIDLCYRTADRIRIIFFSNLSESDLDWIAGSDASRDNGLLGAVVESMLTRPHGELLDEFLDALRLRNYNKADRLLIFASKTLGPSYADALYQVFHEYLHNDIRDAEARTRQIVSRLRKREWLQSDTPFQRVYDDGWRDLTPNSLTPIDAPERTRNLSFGAQWYTAMPGVGESMRFASRLGIGEYVPCFVFFTDIGKLSVDVFPIAGLSSDKTYGLLREWIDRFYAENRFTIDKWTQVEREIVSFSKSTKQSLTTLRDWLRKGDNLWYDLRSTAQLIAKVSSDVPSVPSFKSTIDDLSPYSPACQSILSNCEARLAQVQSRSDERRARAPQDPESELFAWWKNVQDNLPSLKEFKRLRKKWSAITANRHHYDKFITANHNDYDKFLSALFELPLVTTPDAGVAEARTLLAHIVQISPQSAEWQKAFSLYSSTLSLLFRQICERTPPWIRKADLKISDVVPFRRRGSMDFKKSLQVDGNITLHQMIANAAVDWSDRLKQIFATNERIAAAEEVATCTLCLEELRNHRRRIGSQLAELADFAYSVDSPTIDMENVERFYRLLNDYDNAINNLFHSHKGDRRVKTVQLCAPISQTLELATAQSERSSRGRSDELKSEIEQSVDASSQAPELLRDIRSRSYTLTPTARLLETLTALTGHTVDLSKDLGQTIKIAESLESDLHNLDDDDVHRLWKTLMQSTARPASRKELVEIILALVGIDPDDKNSASTKQIGLQKCARLVQLDTLAALHFEKLYAMEIDMDISTSQEKRVEVRQRIKKQIIPRLREIEGEFCQIGMGVLQAHQSDFDVKRLVADITKALSRIEETAKVPTGDTTHGNSNVANDLKVLLPRVAALACDEVEPGYQKVVSLVWREAKSIIRTKICG
jgi:hypothetical protein